MENKTNQLKSLFLIIFIVSFLIQFILISSLIQKIILFLIQMLSMIGYTYFALKTQNKDHKKVILKKAHIIMFCVYSINLLYILFFDPNFGRHMFEDNLSFQDYLNYNVNLDIFETIMLFIRGYQNQVVTLETLLRNILGNLVVFMPMAYFLQIFFQKQRKVLIFLITMIVIVLMVEVSQVFLRIGSGDIDDLLLNVIGAMIMFGVLKFIPMHRLYKLLERE